MQKVLTAAQMREVDRLTTERYGIPSIILMENAAHAVARVITEKLGGSVKDRRIVVLCGRGNNGGDGAALARVLWSQGASCFVYLTGMVEQAKGDAKTNLEAAKAIDEKREIPGLNENCLFLYEMPDEEIGNFITQWRSTECDVFVDALLGTGLSGAIKPPYENLVKAMHSGGRWLRCEYLVSVDIPSGIDADLTTHCDKPTTADLTVTFSAPKPGNLFPPTLYSNGELHIANIGSPQELIDDQPSTLFAAEKSDAARWLKQTDFSNDSYKNKRGHALLIAGSENYSGAAVLAGNAAMRSGVGLVTLASPKECKAEIASRLLPDVILTGIDSESIEPELLNKVDAIAVGCGLDANDPAIEKLVRNVVATREVPVIVDAGALWFYSPMQGPVREPGRNLEDAHTALTDVRASATDAGGTPALQSPLILTPHEGEFLGLLGTDDKDAIKDRVAAVREFSQKNNVILVLKGERVLIGEPGGKVVVNPTGNAGLGKAGNGDTLTGILAGFVAQANSMKIDIFETVVAAVYIAGMAGDIAEKKFGKRVMTASDVRECLADAFGQFSSVDS